ncbi:RusA family crossover junction endodeoxyribonuclease [Aminipila luticellarii]|uniref:RusA family crossover junction endodeoxyribonuclease n=2 Tax=Aminipila luticellarii TaxID=2507160 RepID=A0A410PYV7_9FIRM|nr:RusA family crossover junction endodeoxyribonuclease [Aminipila luticellarii]
MESINFTIPLDPKTKKNSMQPRLARNGKFLGMMQSETYQRYERDCLKAIPPKVRIHIGEPVNIKAIYYRQTKRKVDITNLHSALHDVLVKAGVIVDDNSLIVIGTDGSRVKYDKNNPRTEVFIEPAMDETCQVAMKMEEDW